MAPDKTTEEATIDDLAVRASRGRLKRSLAHLAAGGLGVILLSMPWVLLLGA